MKVLRESGRVLVAGLALTVGLSTAFAQSREEQDGNKQIRVRFVMTYTGPSTRMETTRVDYMSNPAYGKLITVAANAGSHTERLAMISQGCAGLSDQEKILFGVQLGSRLSGIYDYSRIDGGPNVNKVVTTEMQWAAIRNGTDEGVCRDAALTLAEALVACGIDPERIRIHAYRSESGGHQVTTIRNADGSMDTINWSEWTHSTSTDPTATQSVDPNIVNTGISERIFDSKGRLIGQRQTGLGALLMNVAGGENDDPYYVPALKMLELEYGALSGGAFVGRTDLGMEVQGAKIGYADDLGKSVRAEGAIVYAATQRDSDLSFRDYKQNVIYMRYLVAYYPEWNWKISAWNFEAKAKVGAEFTGAILYNGFGYEKDLNGDYAAWVPAGAKIHATHPNGKLGFAVETDFRVGVYHGYRNTDPLYPGAFLQRSMVTTRVNWSGSYFQVTYRKDQFSEAMTAIGGYQAKNVAAYGGVMRTTISGGYQVDQGLVGSSVRIPTKQGTVIQVGGSARTGIDNSSFKSAAQTSQATVDLKITPNWGGSKKKKRR